MNKETLSDGTVAELGMIVVTTNEMPGGLGHPKNTICKLVEMDFFVLVTGPVGHVFASLNKLRKATAQESSAYLNQGDAAALLL